MDTRIPGSLTTPAPGATLSGTAGFVFTPTAGFPTLTYVSVDCLGTAAAPQGNGTWTGSGDTRDCADGPNTIHANVSWTDSFGAAHGWTSPGTNVTISNPVRVEVSHFSAARAFSPNGDNQEDTFDVFYCVSRPQT